MRDLVDADDFLGFQPLVEVGSDPVITEVVALDGLNAGHRGLFR